MLEIDNEIRDFDAIITPRKAFNFKGVVIPSNLVKDVVQYIGGFVIRKLYRCPIIADCPVCLQVIEDSTRNSPLRAVITIVH